MKTDKAEIKFQLHEGRDKQTLLDRYLKYDSAQDYRQDFINPYTGENIESKLLGSMREEDSITSKQNFQAIGFEQELNYDSHDDITNLSELIKNKRQEKVIKDTKN